MVGLIQLELAIAAMAGIIFIAVYMTSPWLRAPAGRHLMAAAFAMAVEAISLLLLSFGVQVSIWVFAAGYAVIDAVVIHRLWLLWQARREGPDSET